MVLCNDIFMFCLFSFLLFLPQRADCFSKYSDHNLQYDEVCVEDALHPLEFRLNFTQWPDYGPILHKQLVSLKDLNYSFYLQMQQNSISLKGSSHQETQLKDGARVSSILNRYSPVSELQELCSKLSQNVVYYIDSEGPAHKKVFTATCTAGDFTTKGKGKTKSASKQNAASDMLKLIKDDNRYKAIHAQRTKKKKPIKHCPENNPVSYLQEWSQHRVQYDEGDHAKELFLINCFLDDKQTTGTGKTKRIAKRMAASEMIKSLREDGKLDIELVELFDVKNQTPESIKPTRVDSNVDGAIDMLGKVDIDDAVSHKSSPIDNCEEKGSNLYKNDQRRENSMDLENAEDLLKSIGKDMGYDVKFRDISNSHGYISFASVSSSMSFTCYGVSFIEELSRQEASKAAIEYLFKITRIDWAEVLQRDVWNQHYVSKDHYGQLFIETKR